MYESVRFIFKELFVYFLIQTENGKSPKILKIPQSCIGENAIFNKKNANKCFRRPVKIHTKFTDTIKFRLKIKDYKNAGKKKKIQ